MSDKVWFITGASRGFCRIWAEGALARGDKVVAIARSVASLSDLAEKYDDAVLPLALDVTNYEQVSPPFEEPTLSAIGWSRKSALLRCKTWGATDKGVEVRFAWRVQ